MLSIEPIHSPEDRSNLFKPANNFVGVSKSEGFERQILQLCEDITYPSKVV